MSEPISTEVLPTQVLLVEEKPRRKRRAWIGWLIGILVLAVLLVVAALVGEQLARQYAESYVRERVLESLPVDPETPIAVEIGGGPVLLQAISGQMTQIDVDLPEITIGAVSGSAILTATGVPLDESKPVESLNIELTITEESVRELSGYLSGADLDSIAVGNGVVTVATKVSLLFVEIPITIDLLPSAADGGIAFKPETITLDDQQISVDDLRNNPVVSSLAGTLLDSQVFCVAESLPSAFTISDVAVEGSNLVIGVNGDGVIFSDPNLLATGTCP
jgi:hypothetical protein